jgi:hypothetical protein
VTRSPTSDCSTQTDLSEPLSEYADRLLLSTGLHADDALRIASGQFNPADQLGSLALALRAGWGLTETRS